MRDRHCEPCALRPGQCLPPAPASSLVTLSASVSCGEEQQRPRPARSPKGVRAAELLRAQGTHGCPASCWDLRPLGLGSSSLLCLFLALPHPATSTAKERRGRGCWRPAGPSPEWAAHPGRLLFSVSAPWQCQQLLPPPAAKQQPAGQRAAPGQRGLPVQLRDARASPGARQTLWEQEGHEPWPPCPARAPVLARWD